MFDEDADKYKPVVRETVVGHSTEDRKFTKLGWKSIAKSFLVNPDGSVVMFHTRGEGVAPEVLMIKKAVTEPEEDTDALTRWTFNAGPLKVNGTGFASDFNGEWPPYSQQQGMKTRRFGLDGSNGYSPKLTKSSYLINDTRPDGKVVRGPNYWYKGSTVVTWSSDMSMIDIHNEPISIQGGSFEYDDGDGVVHQVPLLSFSHGSAKIYAACQMTTNAGQTVRVAWFHPFVANVQIMDYINGSLVGSCSYQCQNLPHGNGYIAHLLDDLKLVDFSQDGTQLIIGCAFHFEDGQQVEGHVLLRLSISESRTVSHSFYEFPVPTIEYAEEPQVVFKPPLPSINEGTELTGNFGGTIELSAVNLNTGATYTNPDLGEPAGFIYDHSGSAYSSAGALTYPTKCRIHCAGFSANGDICGVVSTHDSFLDGMSGTYNSSRLSKGNYGEKASVQTFYTGWSSGNPPTPSYLSTYKYTNALYSYERLSTDASYSSNSTTQDVVYICVGGTKTEIIRGTIDARTTDQYGEFFLSGRSQHFEYYQTTSDPLGFRELPETPMDHAETFNRTTFESIINVTAGFRVIAYDFLDSTVVAEVGKREVLSSSTTTVWTDSNTQSTSTVPAPEPKDESSIIIYKDAKQVASLDDNIKGLTGDWWAEKQSMLALKYTDAGVVGRLYTPKGWFSVSHNPSDPASSNGAVWGDEPFVSHY